jgi:hypothetical protein
MNNIIITAACVASIAVSGCAQKSKNIEPSYVPASNYENMSCRQIAAEAHTVSVRAQKVSGVQDKKAKGDAIKTGVAIVVFLPVALFIRGNKETAGEIANLKGQLEALEKVSIAKDCNIEFRPQAAPEAEEES